MPKRQSRPKTSQRYPTEKPESWSYTTKAVKESLVPDPNQQNIVVMEGVRLVFRNFEGKEGPYNQEGSRSFGVILPEDIGEQMLTDGWNVKRLNPSEEEKEQG